MVTNAQWNGKNRENLRMILDERKKKLRKKKNKMRA